MIGHFPAQAPDAAAETRSTTYHGGYQVLSGIGRPAKVEKRHITRNRTSYSCQICRKRKIRCDKIHPRCGACVKNGNECVYGVAEPVHYDTPNNTKPGPESVNGGGGGGGGGGQSRALPSKSPELALPRRGGGGGGGGGDDAGAMSKKLQDSQLAALEEQLARLTSLVEGMRKDSPASRPSTGLQTPLSPKSAHGDVPSARQHDRPRPATATDEPEPGHAQTQVLRNLFCQAVCEELDTLEHLLQSPFGPLAPDGGDAGQECQGMAVDQHSGPLAFHSAAGRAGTDQPPSSSPNCRTCQQAAVDKSIFLLGLSSQQVLAPSNMDLVRGLPSEGQGNVLFRAWMTSVFPVLPYMPMEMVLGKYRAFWAWKRLHDQKAKDEMESVDVCSMPFINAIWYSGVLALSAKGLARWFPGQKRADLAAHYHDQTVRYLAFLSFPTTVQMPFLSTAVLLEFLPVAEQEPLQSSSYLHIILRLAQAIGLSRENSLTGLTPEEAEVRRRMWAFIVRLDTAFSVASGLPPTIDESNVDTRPISEVKEGYIGQPAEREYRQQQDRTSITGPRSVVSVYSLVARAQSRVDGALRDIVRLHTGPARMTRETVFGMNEMITRVEDEIKDMICRLPSAGIPELGFEPEIDAAAAPSYDCDAAYGTPIQDAELSNYVGGDATGLPLSLARYHRQKQAAFVKWARIVLALMCDKMHCVAYAPFLKNARSKLWTTGRQCALHHATSFLRKFVSLATDPVLEPFRWTWPAMYHPTHPAIIVLVDLYERPFSVEAPRNRSWIDRIFALADPASGIVGGADGVSIQRPLHEGGVAVFDQFRGLRASAWRRAGLDPDVLWTEEDQMLVGVARPLTEDQRIAQRLREGMLYDHAAASPANNTSSPASSSSPSSSTATAAAAPPSTASSSGVTFVDPTSKSVLDYALSERAEPVLAANRPLAQRPVRIAGQHTMPFPLSARLKQRCARVEKESTLTAHGGTSEEIILGDIIAKIKTYGKQHHHTAREREVAADLAVPAFHELAVSPRADTRQDQQPPAPAPLPTAHKADIDTVQDVDYFDWERWDAVFSQYGNFADFMEDVQWHHAES